MLRIFNVQVVAFLLFVLLVPLGHLIAYHELIGTFSITKYKALIQYAFLLILATYFFLKFKKNINLLSTLVLLLLFYMLMIIFLNYYEYPLQNSDLNQSAFKINIYIVFDYFLFFLIGVYYKGYEKYKKAIFILYIVLSVNILYHIDSASYMINMYDVEGAATGIYLFLGDTYAIVSLLVISLTKNKKLKYVIIFFSMIPLFFLLSRSALYMFIVTVLIYMYYYSGKKDKIVIVAIVVATILYLINSGYISQDILETRQLRFFTSGEDSSFHERELQIASGIQAIKEHPIIGDYAGDVIAYNATGGYIHNYLSMWRQYGLLPFLIIVFLAIYLIKEIYKWLKNKKDYSMEYKFFILLSIFVLLEIITARSINSPYLFYLVGILSGMQKNNSWVRNESRRRTI